ncbi:helix-turn-helix domain-containing protein [Streptomyces sp. NPDC087428]|uniref:AraC family transcriptional regulator n=1 Tax=Streptomyces sp. NPDC087428 TaxID=3365788 RepID=UPI0037FAF451
MAGFRIPRAPAGGLRVVPHPAVMLLLDFGTSPAAVDDGAGRRHRGSLVAGPGFGFGGAARAWGENIECVQVRLSPVIARAVLDVCPADLDSTSVALDGLWGREASRMREQLSENSSWEERFALTAALLARRRDARFPVDPEVAWAWNRIALSRGRVRVGHLAAELGWSRKRLWSRFHAQTGMPPKRAVNLVRFDHAAHQLVSGEGAARVAADGGYFDQSHLHREVMAFSGVTPANVAGEQFLTVDATAWPAAHGRPRVARR